MHGGVSYSGNHGGLSTGPRPRTGNITFLSAMVEGERLRILKCCSKGSAIAKAKGIKLGCEPKLSKHQRQVARRRAEAGESARSNAKDLGVHQPITSKDVLRESLWRHT
jgi:DNA invertase Pin-like site-specific DNA recombinase